MRTRTSARAARIFDQAQPGFLCYPYLGARGPHDGAAHFRIHDQVRRGYVHGFGRHPKQGNIGVATYRKAIVGGVIVGLHTAAVAWSPALVVGASHPASHAPAFCVCWRRVCAAGWVSLLVNPAGYIPPTAAGTESVPSGGSEFQSVSSWPAFHTAVNMTARLWTAEPRSRTAESFQCP